VKNPNVHFVFLVRNPHAISISFYKNFLRVLDDMDDLIGVKKLYEIFDFVKRESVNPVKVLFSEQFFGDPEGSVKTFCEHFDLPFDESQLHWTPFDETFDGVEEWNEIKYPEHLFLWHGNAIRSSGIGLPQIYEVNKKGEPTFSEVRDVNDRKQMKSIYQAQFHGIRNF